MFTIEGKEYEKPVLTFSNWKYAEKANRQISYGMSFDMKTTVVWDEPKPCTGTTRFYINHPIAEISNEELLTEIMDFVDAETVEEFNVSWIPVSTE